MKSNCTGCALRIPCNIVVLFKFSLYVLSLKFAFLVKILFCFTLGTSETETIASQASTTVTHTHTYNTRLQSSLTAAPVANTQPNPSSVENTITGSVQGEGSKLDVEASMENNVEEPASSSKLKKVPFQKTLSNTATPMSGNEFYLPTNALAPKGSIPT